MSIRTRIQNICERIVAWSIRRCVAAYSAVIVSELARIEIEHVAFKTAAQAVAVDHWKKLNELNARLLVLEGKKA